MLNDREYSDFLPHAWDIVDKAPNIEAAITGLRDFLGVDHVIFHSSRIGGSPSVEPYVRLTYSGDWIKRYIQMDYMSIDPVLREGFKRSLPFEWDELKLNSGEQRMIADAIAHGIGPHGLSVPVRSSHDHRGVFSLSFSGSVQSWKSFRSARITDIVEIAHHVQRIAMVDILSTSHRPLTGREIDCLFWTGEGKDAADIAGILEISRHTVRDYLKSARYKLDCVTSSQAVSKAVKLGLLSQKSITVGSERS